MLTCRDLPNWTSTSVPMVREERREVGSPMGSRLSSPGILGALTNRHLSFTTGGQYPFRPVACLLHCCVCLVHRQTKTAGPEQKESRVCVLKIEYLLLVQLWQLLKHHPSSCPCQCHAHVGSSAKMARQRSLSMPHIKPAGLFHASAYVYETNSKHAM